MSAQLVRNISIIRHKIAFLNPTTNDFKQARDGYLDTSLSMHKHAYLSYLRSLIIQIREIRTELKRVEEPRQPGHYLLRDARKRARMMQTCLDTSSKGVRAIRHKLVELDTIEYTVHIGTIGKELKKSFRLPSGWLAYDMPGVGLVVTVPSVLHKGLNGYVASMEYLTYTGRSIKKGFMVVGGSCEERHSPMGDLLGYPITAQKVDSLEHGKSILEKELVEKFTKLANLC